MVEERVTRKLAAILAADMVGYSRLMEMDEEGTIARQKAHRAELIDPKFAEHGGRIVKSTGDGLLVEFASAISAVRCAAEVQHAMAGRETAVPQDRRITYRMGINIGDIVIDGDDILGDGVNIAARMEALAVPGGVCLAGAAYDQVQGKLDLAFEDCGKQSIKNISKPVRVFRLRPDGIQRNHSSDDEAGRSASNASDNLSIVVLPFDYLSSDQSEGFLADAITDQLTTYLARIPNSLVIARNTAFTYKGKPVNARQVGQELGVKYVIEGSVLPAGDRFRLNVQLIDTRTGAHVWAETFDKRQDDRLELQDEIVTHIARALHLKLSNVVAAQPVRQTDGNPDSEALALKTEAMLLSKGPWYSELKDVKPRLELALQSEPNNVRLLSVLGSIYGGQVFGGISTDRAGDIERANHYATRAIAADPDYYMAHMAKAIASNAAGHFEDTIVEAERALDLHPSDVFAHMQLSGAHLHIGEPEKTVEYAERAMRLSPRDPFLSAFHMLVGRGHFMMEHDREAIASLRKAAALSPFAAQAHFRLAAVLGATGHEAEAKEILKSCLSSDYVASKTIAQWKSELRTDNPRYLAKYERLTDGLRRAGMPEK